MPQNGRSSQLIHIDVDRRLGHEWDEWDGKPLPSGGDFSAPASRFFWFAALTIAVLSGAAFFLAYLLVPRLEELWAPARAVLFIGVGFVSGLAWGWYLLLLASSYGPFLLLPERLAERGPFLKLMQWTSQVARRVGGRDRVEHAAVDVFNGLAARRRRKVRAGELLVLIPRCLSKETLDGVLEVAERYGVKAFVATRGQLARRAIREHRPRAVVAVACERDMVSGLHDVAGRIPVLGLTMQLPAGPCKDAVIDLARFESWVREFVEKA
jgi:uncharacterized protein